MTTEQWSSVGKKSPRLFHTILDTRYGHAIYSVGKDRALDYNRGSDGVQH